MMTKKVAILQSNYIPWKGYFDLINSVDEFVLYDNVQYTRRDWRNRNKIKTPTGTQWLTIPVLTKGKYTQRINETQVSDRSWHVQHWKTLVANYQSAPCFGEFRQFFEHLYMSANFPLLSQINFHFLSAICQTLGIQTKLSWSSNYEIIDGKTERLVSICQQCKATEYITGPAAGSYVDTAQFRDARIKLTFFNYADYPEYSQLFPPFEHAVTILDLIFNMGERAPEFMKSFQRIAAPQDDHS